MAKRDLIADVRILLMRRRHGRMTEKTSTETEGLPPPRLLVAPKPKEMLQLRKIETWAICGNCSPSLQP